MVRFGVNPLDEATWPDFAQLVERHNGVWGGCWCMAFHAEGVGRGRGQGVTSVALQGALDEIARLGGGTVESYPEDVTGRTVSGSFLHNATVSLFERHGFERTRRLGKNRWVVAKVVCPAN